MLPGLTMIKKCSACSGLIKEVTMTSGNTFGAIFWTDGKREAPMLPEEPWLVKCPHCDGVVWIDELDEVAEIEPFDVNDEYENAWPYEEPTFQDYLATIQMSEYERDKECYLRVRAWWAGNDTRRLPGNRGQALSGDEIDNLEMLYNKLEPSNENDRIMMAEIKRELGQFEAAEAMLNEPSESDLLPAVSIILGLVQKRDRFVATMNL